jgi:hypothetical protein
MKGSEMRRRTESKDERLRKEKMKELKGKV